MTVPAGMNGCALMSEPQTPHAATRITNSSGPGLGSGSSTISNPCASVVIAALTRSLPLSLLFACCCGMRHTSDTFHLDVERREVLVEDRFEVGSRDTGAVQ